MSNKEKNIPIVQFLGIKADWESWPEKFLLCGKHKKDKNSLVNSGSASGVDKIPMQGEFENSLDSDQNLNKNFLKLCA